MLKNPQIIIVDDHLVYRESLKSILTSMNIADIIGEASNGVEFIKILPQLKPDLVIMDIDMPQMNGIEATKKALKLFPNLKIIISSMFGDNKYRQQMNDLGIKAFVLKSGGINELEKVIQDVMNCSYLPFEPDNKIRPLTAFENDKNSEKSTVSENSQSYRNIL